MLGGGAPYMGLRKDSPLYAQFLEASTLTPQRIVVMTQGSRHREGVSLPTSYLVVSFTPLITGAAPRWLQMSLGRRVLQ